MLDDFVVLGMSCDENPVADTSKFTGVIGIGNKKSERAVVRGRTEIAWRTVDLMRVHED
jgi:hypothetical protein